MENLTESDLTNLRNAVVRVQKEVAKKVIGSEAVVRLMFISMLTDNHMLLEGVPGLAKTLLANEFSRHIGLDFKRIQFTPDMLPSDVTGNMIFNLELKKMEFRKGPIFTNVLLADELNRTPPKVHSALLEGMEEKHVSVGGYTDQLPEPFFVIATQNPIEQEGTFPLAEALMDRFLFRYNINYPTREEELDILRREADEMDVYDTMGKDKILSLRKEVPSVRVTEEIMSYIIDIIRATREDSRVFLGASPRTSYKYLNAAKANALINGRDYVIPEDVKYLAAQILNHRLILHSETLIENAGDAVKTSFKIINSIVSRVEAPK